MTTMKNATVNMDNDPQTHGGNRQIYDDTETQTGTSTEAETETEDTSTVDNSGQSRRTLRGVYDEEGNGYEVDTEEDESVFDQGILSASAVSRPSAAIAKALRVGSDNWDDKTSMYIGSLKKENEQFVQNFETLRKRYLQVNKFHDDQRVRWESMLQQKSMEFDTLRQRFDEEVHHMHRVQLKLTEELEIRSRLEQDLQEADQFRHLYQKTRGELEMCKSTYETEMSSRNKEISQLQSDLRELKKQHDDLQLQCMNMKTELSMRSKHEGNTINGDPPAVRHLQTLLKKQQELHDAQIEQLRAELKDLSAEKSELVAFREEQNIMHAKRIGEVMARTRDAETELERTTTNKKAMQIDLEAIRRQCEVLQDKLTTVERDLLVAQGQKREIALECQAMKRNLTEEMEKVQRKWNCEKMDLESSLNDSERRNRDLQSREKQLRQELAMTKETNGDQLKTVNEEHAKEYRILQDQEESHRKQIEVLEKALALAKDDYAESMESLRKENTALVFNVADLKNEGEQLKETNVELEAAAARFKHMESGWEQERNDMKKERTIWNATVQAHKEERNDLSMSKERLEMTVNHLQEQGRKLEIEVLNQKRSAQEGATRMKEQHQQNISSMEKHAQEQCDEVLRHRKQKARLVVQLEKLKRKCRNKLRLLEQDKSFANKQYENAQQEIEELRLQLSAAERKRHRQVNALERQRDHIQMLLEQQSAIPDPCSIDTNMVAKMMDISTSADRTSPMTDDSESASNAFDMLYQQTLQQSEQIRHLHQELKS